METAYVEMPPGCAAMILVWTRLADADGIRLNIAYDALPSSYAKADRVFGIDFYWYIDRNICGDALNTIIDYFPEANINLISPTLDA